MDGWLLVARDEVPLESSGGILLTANFVTGTKKAQAWVIASRAEGFEPGDAILLSPGVAGAITFGEGQDEIDVYPCSSAQVMARFDEMPVSFEVHEDFLQGMTDLPANVVAVRFDRKADEGIPIRERGQQRNPAKLWAP